MHTHTLAGMAVAAQQGGLLPLNQMMMEFEGRAALHDYEASGTSRSSICRSEAEGAS
jgi:ribulose-5-phosphate 4-epimerase/fuculose-1-phosphate aldolase